MTDERIQALESIGFTWSLSNQKDWHQMYSELKRYYSEHNDTLVPAVFPSNPKVTYNFQLGFWDNISYLTNKAHSAFQVTYGGS